MEASDLLDDVDVTKRTVQEWEDLYGVDLFDEKEVVVGERVDEFEFAWRLTRTAFMPRDGKEELAEAMEARALQVARDVLTTADPRERRALKSGAYAETKYVTNYRNTHPAKRTANKGGVRI